MGVSDGVKEAYMGGEVGGEGKGGERGTGDGDRGWGDGKKKEEGADLLREVQEVGGEGGGEDN